MHLNTLKPAEGAKKKAKRVGRGIGSTLGKTCGKGHKGQLARSGGTSRIGFEGGQMPLKQRLPKFGFTSRKSETAEIRLSDLNQLDAETVDLNVLKTAKLIKKHITSAKIIATGELTKKIEVKGLRATAAAKKSIEAAGGSVVTGN